MNSPHNQRPGHRERHLLRKQANPLFASENISASDIQQARAEDAREAETFLNGFRDLVKQALEFKPTADADVILKFKEQLDKAYEQCAGLPGDQTEIKTMLRRLLAAIMRAIWNGIGNDIQAREKLEMEEEARELHFNLLEQPLIADLLRPDSLITEDELVPTLLSETPEALQAAVKLFSPEQLMLLYQQASDMLKSADSHHPRIQAAQAHLHTLELQLQPPGKRPN